MKNHIVSYRKLGGWLMVIFVFGVLNAVGDVYTLIQAVTGSFTAKSFFFGIFANRSLFLIASPLTLFCNVLFCVFIATRKLLLFKIFFFVACVIALIHLFVNVISLYPLTIFDILVSADISVLIMGIFDLTLRPMLGFLQKIYPAFIVTGILLSLGILFICFLYFKRSKRVAVYFGSNHTT